MGLKSEDEVTKRDPYIKELGNNKDQNDLGGRGH